MRQWIRDHAKTGIAVILAVATVVGTLAALVKDLRDWFDDHALIGWLVGLAATTVVIVMWMRWDRDLDQSERTIAQKDAEIADLANRLHPTKRDLEQFSEVLEALPWGRGVLGWLQVRFTGKKWYDSDSDPLYDLHDQWRERFFDDAEVQTAFTALCDAIDNLTEWLSSEGFADSRDPALNVIASGSERPGGRSEYEKALEEARRLKDAVLESRREFEQVGRQRGL